MAHLIEDDVRFMEVGTESGASLAWHRLGTVIPRAERPNITVADAFKRAGLLWDVSKYPLCYRTPDGRVIDTDKFVIVRGAHEFRGERHDEKLLSEKVVGQGYTPLDNAEIAAALEPIRARWPIETAGVLRGGRTVFACFDAGRFAVKGTDEHQLFMVAIEVKDGTGAMTIIVTPVRAVCNNTVQMGLEASEWSANIRHDADAVRDLGFWARVVPQLAEKSDRVQMVLDELASHKAEPAILKHLVELSFPLPNLGHKSRAADLVPLTLTAEDVKDIAEEQHRHDLASKNATGYRDLAYERYDVFNQQNPRTRQTLYAACHAINETAMWTPGRGSGMFEQQIVGWRADTSKRAFREAVRVMEGKPLSGRRKDSK